MKKSTLRILIITSIVLVLFIAVNVILFNLNGKSDNADSSSMDSSISLSTSDSTSEESSSEESSSEESSSEESSSEESSSAESSSEESSSEASSSEQSSSKETSSEQSSSKETSSEQSSSKDTSSESKPNVEIKPVYNPLDDGVWNLILVSESNPLPDNFSVSTKKLPNGKSVDARIYNNVIALLDDAKALGLSLDARSTYRSVSYQQGLFDKKIAYYKGKGMSDTEAYNKAKTIVAVPGCSEHNAGLAIDFVTSSYQVLDEGIAKTAALKWLAANAHNYGFILRYTKENQHITGIISEPWHFRYVGVEAATAMKSSGQCLEQYLGLA